MAGVNILLRGQSNALHFADYGGAARLEAELEASLPGVDVHLLYAWGDDASTIHSGTAFMDWDTGGQQASLLAFVDGLSADLKDNPTATLWMHNEYEQQGSASAAQWMAAVREDAELVRDALGQDASTTPYEFTYVPYNYGGNWRAIQDGMRGLAADASFNASTSLDAMDGIAMDGDGYPGSSHMGWGDAQTVGARLADAMADTVAELAGMDTGGGGGGGGGDPGEPPERGWLESFDGGDWGRHTHWWGNIETREGEVSLTGLSGQMVRPAGREAGDGYGYREFLAKIEGSGAGPAIVLWPCSDAWPGPEIDIGEIWWDGSGQYAALHWRGEDGSDQYELVDIGDHRGKWARYGIDWRPDRVDFYVDGELKGSVDHNVPKDFAHGGEDVTTGWPSSIGIGPGDGRITVSEVSFDPYDGGDPGDGGGGGGLQARLDALEARFDARREAAEDAFADDPERLAVRLAVLDAREEERADEIAARFADGGSDAAGVEAFLAGASSGYDPFA